MVSIRNILGIEDGVAIMRRDASHAESTSYTHGMRARLAECRTDIARRVEDSKWMVRAAESRSTSAPTVRRQVEVAKLRADLERVIQMFNVQNKICVGPLPRHWCFLYIIAAARSHNSLNYFLPHSAST